MTLLIDTYYPCGLGESESRLTAPMQIVKGDRNRQCLGYDVKLPDGPTPVVS